MDPNEIDVARLQAAGLFGRVEWHDELSSTNDRALAIAADPAALPQVVVCRRQTAGRGRGANRWWSGPGALTFSLLLDAGDLRLSPAERPKVSLAAGLGVCEALRQIAPAGDYRLKWPNDVYLAGRKLCGILVEIPPAAPQRLIIGIGLNVNNSLTEAPPEVQQRAIALIDARRAGGVSPLIGGRESRAKSQEPDATGLPSGSHPEESAGSRRPLAFDLTDVLQTVAARVLDEVAQLAADPEALARRWQDYCLLQGRVVYLATSGGQGRAVGFCRGIESDGALVLQTEIGRQRFISGVVERWE